MNNEYNENLINKLPEVWMLSRNELSKKQKEIINDFSNSFLVTGGAGSGKTVIATYKLMDCINADGIKESVMFSYTKALRNFIREGIIAADLHGTINLNSDDSSIIIKNINNIDNIKLVDFESMEITNCIVDEVQDISEEKLLKIFDAFENIMLFGDDGQKLYNNGISIDCIKKKYSHRIKKIYELDDLYRSPYKILEYASKIICDSDILKNCKRDKDSGVLKIYQCKDIEDEREKVYKIIEEYNLKNVCILTNENETCKETVEFFKAKKMRCSYKCKNEVDLNYNNTKLPTILTYHSAKGLQFENVFLIHCGLDLVYSNHNSDNLNYLKALFVSCTRATERLYILYSGKLNTFMSNIDERINK